MKEININMEEYNYPLIYFTSNNCCDPDYKINVSESEYLLIKETEKNFNKIQEIIDKKVKAKYH
jgi:hypothetical protein